MSQPLTTLLRPFVLFQGVTALTGGGAGKLDGIATVSLSAGLSGFLITSSTVHFYQLTAGTLATSSPDVIRPTDYAGGTNEKYWKLQGVDVSSGITGVLTTANNLSDLASAGTARTNLGLGTAATKTAGAAGGVADLDGTGKVPTAQLPSALILSDATTTDKGIIQLAGVLGGTATAPTLAAGAATDTVIGSRTVNDALATPASSGTLTQLLSWIGVLIKGITGKASWLTAPRTTLENAVKLNGDTMTGDLVIGGRVTADKWTNTQAALTYAGTTNIDFDSGGALTLALTGNVTLTTSNRAAGKVVKIKILCDGTLRTFTLPAWIPLGAALPASIAADKTAILSLECWGTTDASITAAYAVQP